MTSQSTRQRTGARILADQLRLHRARMAFGVPGESYLSLLDALYDTPDIRMIVTRHEAGAANMAEAYGKLTGEPGLCLVTRGPGASHAAIGCHTAFQDSTPMILFVGQVARGFREREAFQEVDYRTMFAPLAKWIVEVDDAGRIPELIARAYRTATSGRQGPVVVVLPEDMLDEETDVPDGLPYAQTQASPDPEAMGVFAELLGRAERPLMIVGGGGWSAQTRSAVEAFAERHVVPVCASFRCQDYFGNDHALYGGHVGIGIDPSLATRIRESDLLIAAGPRLGEMTTGGYTLIRSPIPAQPLVHIHPDADEIGRVYHPHLGIASGSAAFANALARLEPAGAEKRRAWAEATHSDQLNSRTEDQSSRDIDLAVSISTLRALLPADAIVTNGAGNYTAWLHRYFTYGPFRSQLAPTSGAMGYGVPAAIAAKLVHPERAVACLAGDGCFMMSSQELATAAQYGAAVLFIVINNGMLGTIRMHQERHFPGRSFATDLQNPDFAGLARAHGMHAETVLHNAELQLAIERALQSGGPSLVEIRTDAEQITPTSTISALRGE